MLRRLLPVLLVLLALGVFAAGCGGDDDDDSGDTTAVETTTDETTTADTTTEDTTTEDGGGEVAPEIAQAQKQCKQAVNSAGAALSEDAKNDLEGLCDELDSTDPEALEATAREVCVRVVEETIPEGAARDQAVNQCETAGITP
jgi:hypothetical protein